MSRTQEKNACWHSEFEAEEINFNATPHPKTAATTLSMDTFYSAVRQM